MYIYMLLRILLHNKDKRYQQHVITGKITSERK